MSENVSRPDIEMMIGRMTAKRFPLMGYCSDVVLQLCEYTLFLEQRIRELEERR